VERPPFGDPRARVEAAGDLAGAADGVSRRRLILAAAGAAGTGLAAAAVLPITALGPGAHVLNESPWRAGVALVDEDGAPIEADAVPIGSFITAFPRGADKRELGSPVVVVHVDPLTLELPAERRGWAPEGLLAYSKICTHAGCAVSLFRHPLNEDTSGPPALVCPCHYSTFDVRRAAKVTLGPAGRPLPQLPLRLDEQRRLVAGGRLSGSVGPAWWGTERA
jgi:ubiquinol-cytochrome c reductase iron-sulfur subunit